MHANHIGVEIGMTDPIFRRHFKERHSTEIEDRAELSASEEIIVFPGTKKELKDIKYLKKHWDGPIILEGTQIIESAKRAVDSGV
jgi:lactate 2-monooxygenase